MNYRHIFHAGNACDVLKHAVVAMIVSHLKAKAAPFAVLDAHAGIGLYDLTSEASRKTGEAASGIGALFGTCPHPAFQPYVEVVNDLNPDRTLTWYPGSPIVVRRMLRAGDRLIVNELHPDDVETLKSAFAGDRQVGVWSRDAYDAVKAFIPPRERRGLVLIDPPFEAPDEFARMAERMEGYWRRWQTGIFVAWYPIKERPSVWRFHEAIVNAGIERVLVAEVTHHPEDTHLRLNGSGVLIINPPWRLDATLADALPALHRALPGTGGGCRVEWLVPEA